MTNEQETRLNSYLSHIQQLKEKKPLNQITETEVLQFFIQTCINIIDECPTTEVSQMSIINLICMRASLHSDYEEIKKRISAFLFSLNTYLKENIKQNEEKNKIMQQEIFNAETILIKIIQVVIFYSGLFMDNLLYGIARFKGAEAELQLHELSQEIELGKDFWKKFYNLFIQVPCTEIYKNIIEEKQFTMTRDQNFILVHFPITQYLQSDATAGALSRIQNLYLKTTNENGTKALQFLRQFSTTVKKEKIETGEYENVFSKILSMDILSKQIIKLFQENQTPQNAEELANILFHLEQTQTIFFITKIIIDTIWSELTTIFPYQQGEMQRLRFLMLGLNPEQAPNVWPFLFLCELKEQIQNKAGDNGNKISLRQIQERKIPLPLLKEILQKEPKKELQKQLITLQSGTKTFLFRPTKQEELETVLAQFVDKNLKTKILQAWKETTAGFTLLLLINLKALARGTTNLAQKVTEVLTAFNLNIKK